MDYLFIYLIWFDLIWFDLIWFCFILFCFIYIFYLFVYFMWTFGRVTRLIGSLSPWFVTWDLSRFNLRCVEWVHGLFLFPLVYRENVVATCKIGSFLCCLDTLLQKNVIVLFFENQISKWRSFEKRASFDLLFTFSSHQGKVTKILSAHMSLTFIHIFCSPYWLFYFTNFEKKIRIYQPCTVSFWNESYSYSRHFGTINK